MYEAMTYEYILQRMLDKAVEWARDNNEKLDTREGSVMWYACAPAAIELQNMYIELERILKEMFGDTASREFLIKHAAERGVFPKLKSRAVLRGVFNIDVPLGSRFSLGLLNYAVTEKISDGVFSLECETAGTIGNHQLGKLIPIEYINGLQSAELTELLIPGEDDEDTERLRKKYIESFNSMAFGGNVADYKEKVNKIDGVGGVKVYRAWNGGGTVKLVIIGADYKTPTGALVNKVQTLVDPEQNRGEGLGLAPVDHVVTVFGVDETPVNISTDITFDSSWELEDLKPLIAETLDNYFSELSEQWEDAKALTVRVSQIESRLLALSKVVDITGTTLNGKAENLTLGADCIPVRGELSG